MTTSDTYFKKPAGVPRIAVYEPQFYFFITKFNHKHFHHYLQLSSTRIICLIIQLQV